MKYLSIFLLLVSFTSCQVTETITINPDGSGVVEMKQDREENSYMRLAGEEYTKENVFKDTTYIFKDYINKYNENFLKYLPEEQQLFQKYANVKVHTKRSSFEKEYRNEFVLHFNTVSEIPDLYKTEDYASDIEHNYALSAENHYFRIGYNFDGKTFSRLVSIINETELEKAKKQSKEFNAKYGALKLVQSYVLNYHFPRNIKSVSNSKAFISADKRSLTLEFLLSDCLQDPEMTNLEVVFE
ncbi:hypothetical protein [Flavobacterium johnsoniae]|uniref:hypothetical protein n=1 Tax=Flavobacterium johnsoniae TaxID=986 RepID=UPI0011ED7871|nr:hypothetical protein [Flavobacterium johnsoniae]